MIKLFGSTLDLVRANRRPYIVINSLYYGLVVVFMIYVAFNQPLQEELMRQIGESFMTGPLSFVGSAYIDARVLTAIAVTFAVNLLAGSIGTITLPSLIIPYSGLLIGFYRAVLWGLILSPAHPDMRFIMIPHSITLLLEGQAYVLAMLAAFLQGKAFLNPQSVGQSSRMAGYLHGLRITARIYVLVIAVLAIAAIYEVIEVVILMNFSF